MCYRVSCVVVVCVLFAVSSVSAEEKGGGDDLAARIMKYFGGGWSIVSAKESDNGKVRWRPMVGGKALVGTGKDDAGNSSAVLAGWDPSRKIWVHTWFSSDGSGGCLEISKFEKNTYFGTCRIFDGQGKVLTGPWQTKVIDQDHFKLIHETSEGPITSEWERTKARAKK